jgi:GNAT superfamily N-acetyltransferase
MGSKDAIMTVEIKEFDYRNAAESDYIPLNDCRNQIRAESLPDDPPLTLDETIQGLKNYPTVIDMSFWTAWVVGEEKIAAYGMISMPTEDNLHLGQFGINVLPAFRRQGFGRKFLSKIVNAAQVNNRRLLIANTRSKIPAGEAFMLKIGAEKGIEGHTNQLVIADLDLDLLNQWQERARERGEGYETGMWDGPYPEDYLPDIMALHDLLNQQPFGDLDVEDVKFSEERIRQTEKSLFSQGYERWTLYVRETETGKFAGYTEVIWNPNRPEIIDQGITGVFPDYRNKGLGRQLKAEMLDRIITERPGVKYVRTDNADSNAPMMKINNELGFKPYSAECLWQIETQKAAEYLSQFA